jgi:hypothetical protein
MATGEPIYREAAQSLVECCSAAVVGCRDIVIQEIEPMAVCADAFCKAPKAVRRFTRVVRNGPNVQAASNRYVGS